MMTCEEIAEFLADYLEQSLPFRQRMAFRLHLALCRDCRRYLATYEKTQQLIQTLRSDEAVSCGDQVPQELVQAILAARASDADGSKPRA
jgi:predicted anti-sigma-YlaC factor YlaD